MIEKMIKCIAMLTLAIMPICAESIDEMKKRFMDEIEACDNLVELRLQDYRIQCQLKINNKLMLLYLIEQMKEKNK